jgi:hypothetical protein
VQLASRKGLSTVTRHEIGCARCEGPTRNGYPEALRPVASSRSLRGRQTSDVNAHPASFCQPRTDHRMTTALFGTAGHRPLRRDTRKERNVMSKPAPFRRQSTFKKESPDRGPSGLWIRDQSTNRRALRQRRKLQSLDRSRLVSRLCRPYPFLPPNLAPWRDAT